MADTLEQPLTLHPVRRDAWWDRQALKDIAMEKAPALVLRLPGGVPLELFFSAFWMLPVLIAGCALLLDRPLLGLWLALCLFVAILLHEFGHALAARATRHHVVAVHVGGFAGLCLIEPLKHRGAGIAFMVAGPAVNLLLLGLCFAAMAALMAFGDPIKALYPEALFTTLDGLRMFAILNAFFFVYNLLPIVPLDGGQVLRLCLTAVLNDKTALRLTGAAGLLTVGAFPVAIYIAYQEWGVFLPILPPPLKPIWHMVRHGEVPIPPQPVRVSTLA